MIAARRESEADARHEYMATLRASKKRWGRETPMLALEPREGDP